MDLADALMELEMQPSGVGNLPNLDVDAVNLLRKLSNAGGLPVSVDCRDKILAVSEGDLAEVILPLCAWLKGLADDQEGDETGGVSLHNPPFDWSCVVPRGKHATAVYILVHVSLHVYDVLVLPNCNTRKQQYLMPHITLWR